MGVKFKILGGLALCMGSVAIVGAQEPTSYLVDYAVGSFNKIAYFDDTSGEWVAIDPPVAIVIVTRGRQHFIDENPSPLIGQDIERCGNRKVTINLRRHGVEEAVWYGG